MPSSVVHLFCALKLAKDLEIKSLPQFLLGAISPDAVNLNGFADEKTRYAAHIRSKNYDEWLNNIKNFYKENLSRYEQKNESDFFKGFAVHLLTDIAWDLKVQPKLFKALEVIGVAPESFREEKWQELYRFNGELMKDECFGFLKEQLRLSEAVCVSTVSEELLVKFIDELLGEEYKKTSCDPPLILKRSDIDTTVDEVRRLFERIV